MIPARLPARLPACLPAPRPLAALALAAALAACGAAGEPEPVAPRTGAAPGVTVSGEARIGVTGSF